MKKILSFISLIFISLQSFSQIEKLQAAFIFQFTKMIEWCPQGKQGDFQLVLFGNDTKLQEQLLALNGRMVGTQKIVFSTTSSPSGLSGSEVVVVSESSFSRLADVLGAIGNACALVITIKSGGAASGAGISFVESGGKLLFEINRSYMQNHSLNVNDQLYKLAKKIY